MQDTAEKVEGLSKEEIQERRKKITEYYEEHIPHLKIQLEYDRLLTEIEENRAKRVQAQKFMAQVMAPEGTEEVQE